MAIQVGIGLLALAWFSFAQAAAVPGHSTSAMSAPATVSTVNAPVDASRYYLTTAQLDHPLRPLDHLPKNAAIRVHAAVVTVPDPVETRLGRSFDIELAALTSAFQASKFVLDGFAFTWTPRAPDKDGNLKVDRENRMARDQPSVMLFRKDNWRWCGPDSAAAGDFCGSTYFVLFLVGETPTSGVHPQAFARAARCAMALDDAGRRRGTAHPGDFNDADCDKLAMGGSAAKPVTPVCAYRLNVIGPAFSGSMESMAAALRAVASDTASAACTRGAPENGAGTNLLDIFLLSPSASIANNDGVKYHEYLQAAATGALHVQLHYRSLAYSVSDQIQRVREYVRKRSHGSHNKVVVFSEESSFGQEAAEAARAQEKVYGQLVNVSFPPNIASIRAEHVRVRQARDEKRRQIMPGRLLELDLTGVDQGIDQPPVYQPSLSSRSDELMLYQTFDDLNENDHPAAVIIVATDVRDRLFLLSEIRNALPSALPIVLEQDNLLVHPDYRKVSRGSITMPAGRTLVYLAQAYGGRVAVVRDDGNGRRHFAFATDYAANTFKAIVRLANFPDELLSFGPQPEPAMLVATLAGFQEINERLGEDSQSGSQSAAGGGILIVADSRLQLQQPVYLAMFVCFILGLGAVLSLLRNGRRVALVSLPVIRYALRWDPVAPNGLEAPHRTSMAWLGAWLAFALAGTVLAGAKVASVFADASQRSDDLAHARDAWTLLGLCLGYACVIAFATLRSRAWNAHCAQLSKEGGNDSRLRRRLGQQGRFWSIVATLVLLLACLYLSFSDQWPASVDAPWVSALGALFALGGSAFFLVVFIEGLDRWRRICLELGKAIRVINAHSKANPDNEEWPTPGMLDVTPRTPFNIVMSVDNYKAWSAKHGESWIKPTNELVEGQWPFQQDSEWSFADWQAQLVVEMKLAAAAVRTAAWCSVLGAALALVLIQVYPPVYERLQTTLAVILLASGFASIVYAVIRLEKDRLLGRMFTHNKDQLTFGGALSALWPKLLALGGLLVMIFLPDVWDWLGGLVKAVSSFG